ncbi:MAG: hypothetical protein NVV59_11795 [Chitinophagaceae bacterium]|nr:hypothetical protein [Chitinophagaceae bacterium]
MCGPTLPRPAIYMQSWFLDIMVPGWEALVESESNNSPYHAVMALPCRRKWMISYLYQPYLSAQHGYVGPDNSPENMKRFFESIPNRFRYWDFCMNDSNPVSVPGYNVYGRNNRILILNKSYDSLRANFSENCLRNIRKSEARECVIEQRGHEGIEEALDLYIRNTKFAPGSTAITRVKQLIEVMKEKNNCRCTLRFAIRIDWYLLPYSSGRATGLIFLLPANTDEAKQIGSSSALINAFIKDHSSSNVMLDFEGSDIESVDRFYASFGAEIKTLSGS